MAWTRQFPFLIRRRAGDTVAFQIVLRTDASGEPVTSLAGYSIRHTFRAQPVAPAVLLSKQSADASISLTGTVARWQLSATETAELPVGVEIFWDLQITSPDGITKTLRAGRLLLDPQITITTP